MRLANLRVRLRHNRIQLLVRQSEWVDCRPPWRLAVAAKASGRREVKRDAVGMFHAQPVISHMHTTAFGNYAHAGRKAHTVAIRAFVIDNRHGDMIVARRDMAWRAADKIQLYAAG